MAKTQDHKPNRARSVAQGKTARMGASNRNASRAQNAAPDSEEHALFNATETKASNLT